MKKCLAFILFFLMMCSTAWAMPIETTRIGNAYNDGWWYVAGSTYIGPGNRGGTALGFFIAEPVRVSTLSGFIRGVGDDGGYGYVAMSLHRGSRFGHDNHGPLPSNDIIFQSERLAVPLSFEGINTRHDHAVNLDLESGDYWVAFQGGSATPNYMIATGATFEGENIGGESTVPEPATLLLMGGGLAGAIWRRRKVTKA